MPRRPRKKKPARSNAHELRVRWVTDKVYATPNASEDPAFFKLETLQSATERVLDTRDLFLAPSFHARLGPAALSSIVFELMREEQHRFIFRVKVANQRLKTGVFRLVVAKREGKTSERIDEEHQLLESLHRRAPKVVVQPYRGGFIYLPDRRRRTELGRSVFAYVTDWPVGFQPLGAGPPAQFQTEPPRRHVFSLDQSEAIRDAILRIVVATYDPVKRESIPLLGPNRAELHATVPRSGAPRVMLIACGGLTSEVHPDALIHRVLTAAWNDTPLGPLDAERLFDALVDVVGTDTARRWMKRYHDALKAGVYKPVSDLTPSVLERLPLA